MKTFETEKHNIPEGATHYLDETCYNFFYWGMRYDGRFKLMDTNSKEWLDVNSETFNLNCKPIPQTKEVEWVNGDLLEFNGEPCIFIGMSEGFPVVKYTNDADSTLSGEIDEIFATDMLSKPETEAERVEREREESRSNIERLLEDRINFNNRMLPKTISKIIYDAGYRKESE